MSALSGIKRKLAPAFLLICLGAAIGTSFSGTNLKGLADGFFVDASSSLGTVQIDNEHQIEGGNLSDVAAVKEEKCGQDLVFGRLRNMSAGIAGTSNKTACFGTVEKLAPYGDSFISCGKEEIYVGSGNLDKDMHLCSSLSQRMHSVQMIEAMTGNIPVDYFELRWEDNKMYLNQFSSNRFINESILSLWGAEHLKDVNMLTVNVVK